MSAKLSAQTNIWKAQRGGQGNRRASASTTPAGGPVRPCGRHISLHILPPQRNQLGSPTFPVPCNTSPLPAPARPATKPLGQAAFSQPGSRDQRDNCRLPAVLWALHSSLPTPSIFLWGITLIQTHTFCSGCSGKGGVAGEGWGVEGAGRLALTAP